jgi:hypothetical protein
MSYRLMKKATLSSKMAHERKCDGNLLLTRRREREVDIQVIDQGREIGDISFPVERAIEVGFSGTTQRTE